MSTIHTVRAGDTLAKIARAYGMSLSELLQANPRFTPKYSRDPDLLYPGEEVSIPASKKLSATTIQQKTESSSLQHVGPLDKTELLCKAWIGIEARYDDYWNTPITRASVRIDDSTGILVNGGRQTKCLSTFSLEDGEEISACRPELGTYYYPRCAEPGLARCELKPDLAAAAQGTQYQRQIEPLLSAFESSMETALQPWIAEWQQHNMWSIPEAYRRGELKGLTAWWEGEVEFWTGLAAFAGPLWDAATKKAQAVAERYWELPWYCKIAPLPCFVADELREVFGAVQDLWDRRDVIIRVIKAFADGTADTIEHALEALRRLPGEAGRIFTALVERSIDWVEGMLEIVRETDVFQRVFTSLMKIVMMMTPNFWAEGVGTVVGYLIPEVLITIILTIIGALCAAVVPRRSQRELHACSPP